jgi:hypothetical protein
LAASFAIRPARRATLGAIGILCCAAWHAPAAVGQITISTNGVLPAGPLSQSIILGDRQTALAAQWLAPVDAHQRAWIGTINGRANQATSGGVPGTFSAAALDSSIAESAGLRYAMTGGAADLTKSVNALLNAALPANNSNDFITEPELLTSYLSAYDFIRGAPAADLPAATRGAIESRLAGLAQRLSYGNNTASNALGKIGATKALAGELLGNQSLLNTGLTNLQTHYDYSTTDDGWFTDSQGHYLNYTLRHLALFARAYEQGSGVNFYAQIQPLLDMSIGLRKPDGTMPNVSNGLNSPVAMHWFSDTPDPAAASRMLWYFERLPAGAFASTNIENNDSSNSTSFALVNFDVAAAPPARSPTFLTRGQSGVSVFRRDWSASSDYLLLSPGIDSPARGIVNIKFPAFHSHNDTCEIHVAAGGHTILVPSGYHRTDLTNSPQGLVGYSAQNHNVILVDGGLGASDQGRMMRPENFVHTQRLDSTERGNFHGVGDFATLTTRYGEADVSRSCGFANEEYFVVADRMQSDRARKYGFNLIGRGTRTVLASSPDLVEVRWEHGGRQAIEHLVSTHAMTLALGDTSMHDTFDVYEPVKRMTASVSAAKAGFLSVIETGAAGSSPRLAINDRSTADYAAMRATNAAEGREDFILSQPTSTRRTVDALLTDALYAYLRRVNGVPESAMLADGTFLGDGGVAILRSDKPLTLSLAFGPSDLRGTVSPDQFVAGTQLDLYGREIVAATLDGSPLTFLNQAEFGRLCLPASGELVVSFAAVPERSSLALLIIGAGFAALCVLVGRGILGRRKAKAAGRGEGPDA